MTSSAHLFAVLVTLPSLAFIIMLVRRGQLRTKYTMIWLPVCGVVAILTLVPGMLDQVSRWLGISYPPALLFVASIALLLMLCIHFSWELSRLEERVRLLAEGIAIDGVDVQRKDRVEQFD